MGAVMSGVIMARPVHRPGNLPAEATSFVGRRRELAEVRAKLGGARLVSLVGPGGVGKTRLALRAAVDLARGFPDGAWLVELAETTEPALVGHAALAALDLRDQAATEPVDLLLSYLRDKRLLLVVDNCEHLLDATAQLLTAIMRVAPRVRVIATSREPLSVTGEHVLAVPPLALPTALAQLRQNEAVTLFVERAAASSGFELTGANQTAVADLCRRLDGLPLAIELAAVRTRVLSARQILDRLTDRFGLLTGGGRDAVPRHQTLRTTLDWSHDLLTVPERTLLRRLAVFAGRFTLDDVEPVCAFDGLPAAAVLDVLSSLVDKSLVLKEDVHDVACYRLHETMREYAGLRAGQAGETRTVELRCAEHYRERVARSVGQARYRLVEWLGWMDLEIDNVRAVLQRHLGHEDPRGLDLAGLLGWYWITRATSEGVRWLDELLGSGDDHAVANYVRGFLAVLQSDPATASSVLDRAATAAGRAGQPDLRSQVLSMASIAAQLAGDRTEARRLFEAACADAPTDFPTIVALLQARALGGLMQGDLDTARSASAEGAHRSREAGDLYSLGMMLLNLGAVTLIGGDLDASKPLLTESLRIARRIDDRVAQYLLLDVLGCHAAGSGQPRLAARLLGAADTVQTTVGGSVLPYLAPLLAQAREATRAAIGAPRFRVEFEAGQRLNRHAAIELALDEGADAPGTAPSLLSKRQAEIAHLVADGLSNKQIGVRLLISEHTVDSHIRTILTKLGAGSRAQIAAWLASSNQ